MKWVVLSALSAFTVCGSRPGQTPTATERPGSQPPEAHTAASANADHRADDWIGKPTAPVEDGRRLTVRFYDVGQALAVLVDLPDGRHILVDTGDSPGRPGCDVCGAEDRHLIEKLRADLRSAPIDLLWITHQHADHIGGAPEVLESFKVGMYIDNGRDSRRREVQRARHAAEERGVTTAIVDPDHKTIPMAISRDLTFAAIVPSEWPTSCAHDPNECSIGLRIDFGSSSVLFLGDAEYDEERLLDAGGPVTLLQVAHHGSETSTSPSFLSRAKPKYAVISAGGPGQGMNREYCHPRALVVQRLTRSLGGPSAKTLPAFDGERCDRATPNDWKSVPTSERLWATERDGDVVLATRGDGLFAREGR